MSKTSRFERILLLHISPEADGQRWPNLNNLFGGMFKIMWLEQYLLLAFIMPLKEQILLFFKYNYHHSFKKNVIGQQITFTKRRDGKIFHPLLHSANGDKGCNRENLKPRGRSQEFFPGLSWVQGASALEHPLLLS